VHRWETEGKLDVVSGTYSDEYRYYSLMACNTIQFHKCIETIWRNLLSQLSGLKTFFNVKVQTVVSSKKLVSVYQTTPCHIPKTVTVTEISQHFSICHLSENIYVGPNTTTFWKKTWNVEYNYFSTFLHLTHGAVNLPVLRWLEILDYMTWDNRSSSE
jgi:hypothetical protein